jgi:hypothetical protein
MYKSNTASGDYISQDVHYNAQLNPAFDPAQYNEPLNFADLDNAADLGYQNLQQTPFDDWLWNMVTTSDANMFNL